MFILIESEINNDEDMYKLVGTYNKLPEAQKVMQELLEENFDDGTWDVKRMKSDGMAAFIATYGSERSDCVRWLIFDSDDESQRFYI